VHLPDPLENQVGGLEPAETVAAREHGLGIERILPVFPVEEGEHPAGEKGFGQAPKGDRAEKSQLAQSLENGEILTRSRPFDAGRLFGRQNFFPDQGG